MQPSSSRPHSPEQAPARKNKSQSQREYRSKEMDGFSELRNALLLADPFDSPLGRDAARPQLLVAAAKKLRNLAEDNQKLALQLSVMPAAELRQAESRPEMTAQNSAVPDDPWATQGYSAERKELVAQLGDFQSATPAWPHSLNLFHAQEHQQYDMPSEPPSQRRFINAFSNAGTHQVQGKYRSAI